ncbi:Calcium/calmodulin-dependent 3',5'-cyclic nucleotide phosphodiesterase 1B [Perkinsus chesapeaki]|uniref:Calcium/calmodulin-dependent 3',5'-cyclic nucleotide phosphodiesterase 1B n=1 Tax=Perkinsus chesapeaki TaxID=330153 RepID=A0A7J6MQ42_PERCH|nr:Calcium/calmodulin-dependent 3',5'-cyclic nucleotide phosphodiesterase 1B [Perkinsus chesapeaki]
MPPAPRALSAPTHHYDRFYEGYYGDEYYVGVGSVSDGSDSGPAPVSEEEANYAARDGDEGDEGYAESFDDDSSCWSSEDPGTDFEAVLGPIDQIQYKKEKLAKWDAVFIKRGFCLLFPRFSVPAVERVYVSGVDGKTQKNFTLMGVGVIIFAVWKLCLGWSFTSTPLIARWATSANIFYNIAWLITIAMGILCIALRFFPWVLRGRAEVGVLIWTGIVVLLEIFAGDLYRASRLCNVSIEDAYGTEVSQWRGADFAVLQTGLITYLAFYSSIRLCRLVWLVIPAAALYTVVTAISYIPESNTVSIDVEFTVSRALFTIIAQLLLDALALAGKYQIEMYRRKNYLNMEVTQRAIGVLESTINAFDSNSDGPLTSQIEGELKRLTDIERILERARQEGSIGYPEDNKYLLEDVEHAQETSRLTQKSLFVMDFQKEVLLGWIKNGAEFRKSQILEWIREVIPPVQPTSTSNPPYVRLRRPFYPVKPDSGFLDQLGTSAMSLLKAVGRDFSLDAYQLEKTLHENSVGHFARTADFLIETEHELAVTYNDRSVLQNFHAATTFEALEANPTCDPTKWLSTSENDRFRKIVIDCIMSLDVASHFRRVEELEDPSTAPIHLLRAVIRAADMGFTAMPWDSHYSSVERLISEYVSQGDDEWAMGIPVSLYCDSATLDVPGMELGFLEMSTLPLYHAIQKRVDQYNPMASGRMKDVVEQINSNRLKWAELVASQRSASEYSDDDDESFDDDDDDDDDEEEEETPKQVISM